MRKWCLGELATATLQNVEIVVVALPKFSFPDAIFIAAFDIVVGDVNDLAAYGLGRSDLRESWRKLKDQKTITLPEDFHASDVAELIRQLCSHHGLGLLGGQLGSCRDSADSRF